MAATLFFIAFFRASTFLGPTETPRIKEIPTKRSQSFKSGEERGDKCGLRLKRALHMCRARFEECLDKISYEFWPTPEPSQPCKDIALNLGKEFSENFGLIVEGRLYVFVLSPVESDELSSLLKRFSVLLQCDSCQEVLIKAGLVSLKV